MKRNSEEQAQEIAAWVERSLRSAMATEPIVKEAIGEKMLKLLVTQETVSREDLISAFRLDADTRVSGSEINIVAIRAEACIRRLQRLQTDLDARSSEE